jgi:hypothetical protein
MTTIFARLNRSRPAPVEAKIEQSHYAQRVLDFVLRWPRPSIAATDLMTYGPRPRQNAEETLRIASILEKHGWLTRIPTPRKDQNHWNIVRQHSVVHPKFDHSPKAD